MFFEASHVMKPQVLSVDGVITTESILELINVSIIRALPQWSKRAYSAVFDYHANAIIYMIPEMPNAHSQKVNDWRYIIEIA